MLVSKGDEDMVQSHETFVSAVGLPASLDDIDPHLRSLESGIRDSRWGDAERAVLLLEGRSGVRLSAVDFAHVGDRPPLPEDRSIEGLTLHLARLVMPEVHADARAAYLDAFGLDDPCDTAWLLAALDQGSPEGVMALLELDLAQACRLLGWSGRAADPDLSSLLVRMARIRVAFVLRQIAEEVGDQLHNPFRWAPLDGPGGGNSVRLGLPEKKLRKDLALAEHALDLYREGRRGDPRALPGGSVIADSPSDPCVRVATLNRCASEGEARLLLNGADKARAEKWLEELRARHGNGLEDMVENKIAQIALQLAHLKRKLDAHVDVHGRKKRAGNRNPVPPLIRLMIACRYAIAWTQPPPSRFDTKNDADDHRQPPDKYSGIDIALGWLVNPTGACPWPVPHEHHAHLALRLFTILRYVFVDDDYMLPTGLKSVVDLETGEPDVVNSQADAERVTGRRYSFDALIAAHDDIDQPRSEVMREEARLLRKGRLAGLPRRQRAILVPMLQRFASGFMERRLPQKGG